MRIWSAQVTAVSMARLVTYLCARATPAHVSELQCKRGNVERSVSRHTGSLWCSKFCSFDWGLTLASLHLPQTGRPTSCSLYSGLPSAPVYGERCRWSHGFERAIYARVVPASSTSAPRTVIRRTLSHYCIRPNTKATQKFPRSTSTIPT